MSELIQNSVNVSRDEALNEYLFNNTTVQYDVVAFRPDDYKSAMRLTDADLERYIAGHEQEVKDRFKADERLYNDPKRKPDLKLRQIFIAKLEPEAKPEDKKVDDKKVDDKKVDDKKPGDAKTGDKKDDKAAGAKSGDKVADNTAAKPGDAATKPGDKTAAKPGDKTAAKPGDKTAKPGDKTAVGDKAPEKKKVGMPIEAAKAKLEAARAAIASGKQKFAEAAKELSTDEATKATGGDLSWKPADNPGFDDKAVNDAVKALKPGEMTPVIVTDTGVYLVIAEAKREGALTYDQVKLELARALALKTWSAEAARRAALDAQAKATTGTGKNLDQLFKRKAAAPEMTPEMRQMIEQQIQQQTGGAGGDEGPSGSIVYESKDIPAAWKADADGSSGGSTTGATPPAPMAPAGSGATPPGGPATMPAMPAMPAPPPAKPPQDLMTPSKDQLPAFGEITPPTVEKFGPVPRVGYLPGIGKSKDITTALFDELGPNQIAKKIYEVEGVYYVVQAAGKSQPKVEDFDKQSTLLIEGLRQRRGSAAVTEWLRNKCETLVKANKITPAPDMIRESDDQGKPLPVVYRPCMTFK